MVRGCSLVGCDAVVGGCAAVMDNAIVLDGVIEDSARICGNAKVVCCQETNFSPRIGDKTQVYGTVSGRVEVYGAKVILPGESLENPTCDLICIQEKGVEVIPRDENAQTLPQRKPQRRSNDLER